VLQISDSHVSADPEANYRGQNADRNLQSLLPAMRDWAPDLVLLTGDVSEDASPAAYQRVAELLAPVGATVLALPGNHDDPGVMKNPFPLGPWNGPFIQEAGPWALVLLDSTERGSISGSFSPDELARFDQGLRNSSAKNILVALHHQPVPVNAPWIDRYALECPDRFLQHVDRDARIKCIVWGHIHHDFRAERKGAILLGAPSTATNSLPETPRFTFDPAGPACRWLELYGDGRVVTGLLRG
jgi:Icc protein